MFCYCFLPSLLLLLLFFDTKQFVYSALFLTYLCRRLGTCALQKVNTPLSARLPLLVPPPPPLPIYTLSALKQKPKKAGGGEKERNSSRKTQATPSPRPCLASRNFFLFCFFLFFCLFFFLLFLPATFHCFTVCCLWHSLLYFAECRQSYYRKSCERFLCHKTERVLSFSLSLFLSGLGNSCLFLISEPSTYIMPVIARHNKPANYLSGSAYALFIVILSRQFNKRQDETR